jgi:DNA-binding transcriptional ArsR family regulator
VAVDHGAGRPLRLPRVWPLIVTDRLREALAAVAAEVADYHDRLIAPHWERIRAVLEADVSYHAERLAGGGARSLFSDLHPDLYWSAGKLFMRDSETGQGDARVRLGPDGLVLVPSVFGWPHWSIKKATSTQTTLLYPARGTASVWQSSETAPAAVELLPGAPRARLLEALCSPATTTALARRLGVTPSAVSQHLAVLHHGGLVDRQRSGRTVLYQTSELGLALLAGRRPGTLQVGGEPVGHL